MDAKEKNQQLRPKGQSMNSRRPSVLRTKTQGVLIVQNRKAESQSSLCDLKIAVSNRLCNEPKIIGFLCNWCSYAGADLSGTSRMTQAHNLRVIRVMCSSRIKPEFVLEAFKKGADGVLIAGCHPGDCHYMEGNYYTRRRFALLKKLLEYVGIDPKRLRVEWISASEGTKFKKVVNDMACELKKLGKTEL